VTTRVNTALQMSLGSRILHDREVKRGELSYLAGLFVVAGTCSMVPSFAGLVDLHFHDLRREFACVACSSHARNSPTSATPWQRQHHDDVALPAVDTAVSGARSEPARSCGVATFPTRFPHSADQPRDGRSDDGREVIDPEEMMW
jgi:hypothetical protein